MSKRFLCKCCNTYIDKIYDSIYGCSSELDNACKFSNYYDWLEMFFNSKSIYVNTYTIYDEIDILHLYPTERSILELNLKEDEANFYLTHYYFKFNSYKCKDSDASHYDSYYKKDFLETIKDFQIVKFEQDDDLLYDFECSPILYTLEEEIKKIETRIENNLIFL